MTVLEKAKSRGITQAWLIVQLRNRGIGINTADMSRIMHGVLDTPKARLILRECENIIAECDAQYKGA